MNVLKLAHEITFLRSNMSEEESAKHAATAACVDMLTTYLAIASSDINGDIQFTEAGKCIACGTLTPAYDRIADLYNLWLEQLGAAITTFTTATDRYSRQNRILFTMEILPNGLKLQTP